MTTRNGVYTNQARQPLRQKSRHSKQPSSAAQSASASPIPTSVSSSSAVTATRSGRRVTQPLSRSHSVFDENDEEESHQDTGSDSASAGPSRQRRAPGSAQTEKRAPVSRYGRPRASNPSRAALEDSEQERATPTRQTTTRRKGGAASQSGALGGVRKGKAKADEGGGQPQQEEDEESRKKRQRQERELIERWSEEYYDILEQLPLELQRSYVLMRELENKFQNRISLVASQARAYCEARNAFETLSELEKDTEIRAIRRDEQHPDGAANEMDNKSPNTEERDQGKVENEVGLGDFSDMSGDDADADGEEDAEVYQVVSGEAYKEEDPEELPAASDIHHDAKGDAAVGSASSPPLRAEDSPKSPTMRQRRLDILASIARASSDALRIADEKVGVAVTAYDWVDRQIRRLDADLQRNENSLLLGLRAGTEASRGLQDALGLSQDGGTAGEGGKNRWEDVENLLLGRANGKAEGLKGGLDTTTKAPPRKANGSLRRKGRADKRSKDAPVDTEHEDEQGAEGSSGFMTANMAIDPNEPRYCYCDQVSYGDMVACDNEDCPREWFHYPCIGFTNPPKGRWFCLFCAPPGYKGSGTYPADAPCLPPGYGHINVLGGPSRGGGSGTINRHKRKKR